MLPTEYPRIPGDFESEFRSRVQHNFKVYVLLGLKQGSWNQLEILQTICGLDGYKYHKVIKYNDFWSHIHIKFECEKQAENAVLYLKSLDKNIIAEIVDNMLKAWYGFEMRSGYGPPYTYAVIDVLGSFPTYLNPLTEGFIRCVLDEFGSPYVSPYKAALENDHIQVLFSTMAEALAACMALGQWFVGSKEKAGFYYRVRIRPYEKEARLIADSRGIPAEAFKLDYFIVFQHEASMDYGLKPVDASRTQMARVDNRHAKRTHRRKTEQIPRLELPIMCLITQNYFMQNLYVGSGDQLVLQPLFDGKQPCYDAVASEGVAAEVPSEPVGSVEPSRDCPKSRIPVHEKVDAAPVESEKVQVQRPRGPQPRIKTAFYRNTRRGDQKRNSRTNS